VDVTYDADTSGLSAALGRVVAATEAPPAGPLRDGLLQASALYLGFIRRRFVDESRGGGAWPDLALSTKVARLRKTQAGRKKYEQAKSKAGKGRYGLIRGRAINRLQVAGLRFAILRDTSTLFNSLSTGSPGSIIELQPASIRVGTAIGYAKFHQNPTVPGRPPKREIFVAPDSPTERRIQQVLAQAVMATMQQATK
jgi:phage gpG-like protein